MITLQQLTACMPGTTPKAAAAHLAGVRNALALITTGLGVGHGPAVISAAFLAQIGHECVSLKFTEEIGKHAGARYENRADLGNVVRGDGERFKGRGLLQVTGRSNYRAVGKALGIDAIGHPELLASPKYAALSAAWYWQSRKLNQWCLPELRFDTLTRRINGGLNGIVDRRTRLKICMHVLGVAE